jgi:hypothetical protein
MTDEKKIDAMEEPQEVTELVDDELDEVAGGVYTISSSTSGSLIAFPDVCKEPIPSDPLSSVKYTTSIDSEATKTGDAIDPTLGSIDPRLI